MKIQLIRNAMIKITYGGVTFLVDPWLAEKGSMGTFRQLRAAGMDFSPVVEEQWDIPMPMCALPFQRETVLAGVDAYIVTHLHPDHVDMLLDGTVGAPLDHSVPLFVQSADDGVVFTRSGFSDVRVLDGAGDTIWYDGVAETLAAHQPGVIVLNACAARLEGYGRLIMDGHDVGEVRRAAPDADIAVVHMDTVAHACLTRQSLRLYLDAHGLGEVRMPADGETLAFTK